MFQLHTLGWHSFQQLCLAVAREILGQTVQSFLDSNDGGRDGAFSGVWSPAPGELISGRFVIQCKFTARVGYCLTISDLEDEFRKAQRLAEKGTCDVYILMTNAGVSGETERKLEERFKKSGVKEVRVFGVTWLEDQIRESKRLRMMVPRVYGLGDLSQILDERAYEQAAAVLETMREDLRKVVMTESYRKAAKALDAHRFVLLVGEPASGKTTIASLLAMSSADQWGASVLKLATPSSVIERWNPNEESQLFWIDDAFGVTQYERGLAFGWNQILSEVKTMLRKGNRVVMTSRDYIYNRARQDLKEGAFPLFHESQVVINVRELTMDERRQILYNHMRLGRQSRQFRSAIKSHLECVANHPRFIPEIARRLADPFFTTSLHISKIGLENFVEKREQLLIEVCKEMDRPSKAALALIYMSNGRLPSPVSLTADQEEALRRLGSDLGECTTALKSLQGSLVLLVRSDGEAFWTFQHPTIGDAYSAMLRTNPELLGIYVQGSDVEKLMEQVTCGDMGIEGAVELPSSLFPLITRRLLPYARSSAYKSAWLSAWRARRVLLNFLAERCDKKFLAAYLASDNELLNVIANPRPSLEFSAEINLAIRLFKLKLLPEEVRRVLVENISRYARLGQDARVLYDPDLRSLLDKNEIARLSEAVRTEVIPRIAELRAELQNERTSEDDAEWHMRPFTQLLSGIEAVFPQSRRICKIITDERDKIEQWVLENPTKGESIPERDITVDEEPVNRDPIRSIFDDIDDCF